MDGQSLEHTEWNPTVTTCFSMAEFGALDDTNEDEAALQTEEAAVDNWLLQDADVILANDNLNAILNMYGARVIEDGECCTVFCSQLT